MASQIEKLLMSKQQHEEVYGQPHLIVWGGAYHGKVVSDQGGPFSPNGIDQYRKVIDKNGNAHYAETYWLKLFYTWLAGKFGYEPMLDESWSQFRKRAQLLFEPNVTLSI